MTDTPTWATIATAVALLATLGGCSPEAKTVITENTVRVDSGMTIAEVDREVGFPGEPVDFNALLKVFQQKVPGKDGTYRKWTKIDAKSTITVFAEIKDGKVAGSTYTDLSLAPRNDAVVPNWRGEAGLGFIGPSRRSVLQTPDTVVQNGSVVQSRVSCSIRSFVARRKWQASIAACPTRPSIAKWWVPLTVLFRTRKRKNGQIGVPRPRLCVGVPMNLKRERQADSHAHAKPWAWHPEKGYRHRVPPTILR